MKTLQINMKNRSNHILRGFATLPDGEGKFPSLLFLHGFTGNAYGYKGLNTRIARDLAESGIACVRFDFFGNGESDGEFEDVSFSDLYDDTRDMFAWLKKEDFADTEQLFLGGHSMGGYLAASNAPFLNPRGLILLSPGAGMWFVASERAAAVTKTGQDWVDLEGLKYQMSFNYDMANHPSPYIEAQGYGGSVLIARADDDPLVDQKVIDAYAACYAQCETLTTQGGGHNFANIPARQALSRAIIDFIQKQH